MDWPSAPGRAAAAGRGGRGGAARRRRRLTPHDRVRATDLAVVRETGFVRDPAGGVNFDDISISIVRGRAAACRSAHAASWSITRALSTADLNATVARLKSESVKFLERIHPWGTRAPR